jgi:hypothetical protein
MDHRNITCIDNFALTWTELRTLVALITLEKAHPKHFATLGALRDIVDSIGVDPNGERIYDALGCLCRMGLVESEHPSGSGLMYRAAPTGAAVRFLSAGLVAA